MAADDTDIPEFGYLPFDQYIIAEWDSNSICSKKEQHRALVEKWVRLGRYGRRPYFGDPPYIDEVHIDVPQDLLSATDRARAGRLSSTLLIRTWYGDKNDKASQDAASSAYDKLMLFVAKEGDPDYEFSFLDTEFIYDNMDELDDHATPDIVDGIALGTPGSVPSYLITALMHCPDVLDGITAAHCRAPSPDDAWWKDQVDERQNLLVLVADRKACEEGWMLHLAVNHKGKVLPFRIRDPATWAAQYEANWLDGQALAENTFDPEKDEEATIHNGDGWAPN